MSSAAKMLLAAIALGLLVISNARRKKKKPTTYPFDLTTPRIKQNDQEGQQIRKRWEVPCAARPKTDGERPGCYPSETCARVVVDNFVSPSEVNRLRGIAAEGMRFGVPKASRGGPTIMDVNTGFVRDPYRLTNLYDPARGEDERPQFSRSDLNLYKDVIERIRKQVMDEFDLEYLYLTAPTFITREVGGQDHGWRPGSMHDEYWHPHVDKNNTAHYDYSGLLYLADHEAEFSGGMFAFLDGLSNYQQERPCYDEDLKKMGVPNSCAEYAAAGYCNHETDSGTIAASCPHSCKLCTPLDHSVAAEKVMWRQMIGSSYDRKTAHEVEPGRGRLVVFSSGVENLHLVRQVHTGMRLVMSMWFTCNEERKFEAFLDGEAHYAFDHTSDTKEEL